MMSLSPRPDFGDGIAHRAEPCSAAELFSALFLEPEESAHYLEPAYDFAVSLLESTEPAPSIRSEPDAYVDDIVAWASASVAGAARPDADLASALSVVREFAPSGLSEGAWLRGFAAANAVETPVGMHLLRQLMLRFGDPGSREGHAQCYAALLRSVGVSPEALTQAFPWHEPCSEPAYERGLLGVCLGSFPTALGLETIGFNLWMSAVGPCPILQHLLPTLERHGACLRYFEAQHASGLAELARDTVREALAPRNDEVTRSRIGRGFAAAHAAYLRWHAALPFHRVSSPVRAARPERSPAKYTPPQDAAALRAFSLRRHGQLSRTELYYRFANADCFPSIQPFGKVFVESVFEKLSHALDTDERLSSRHAPPYSERCVAELVARQHERNVRSRRGPARPPAPTAADDALAKQSITQIFDGSWLQGFADVQRAHFEEYGWLFRIYASEHGDGDFAWNHCQIFRKAFAELGPDVMLPKTDRRLYALFDVGVASLATLAVSLHTRHFMPEILGINLGIEATGVGGAYLDDWKGAERSGSPWRALAWRLHNSIDNYADGHTKWALFAVQAFMRRVKDAAPSEVEKQWHRIWRPWRCQEILTHGTQDERRALAEYLDVTSLAPTG